MDNLPYITNTSSDIAPNFMPVDSCVLKATLQNIKHEVDMGTIYSEYMMFGDEGLIRTCKIFGVSVEKACKHLCIEYPLDEGASVEEVIVGDTPDKIITDPKTGLLKWVDDK